MVRNVGCLSGRKNRLHGHQSPGVGASSPLGEAGQWCLPGPPSMSVQYWETPGPKGSSPETSLVETLGPQHQKVCCPAIKYLYTNSVLTKEKRWNKTKFSGKNSFDNLCFLLLNATDHSVHLLPREISLFCLPLAYWEKSYAPQGNGIDTNIQSSIIADWSIMSGGGK